MNEQADTTRRDTLPRLLVVSHVLPFPRSSGQQQRVYYTLVAAMRRFHVTFATFVPEAKVAETEREMEGLCDDLVTLPSRYAASTAAKLGHRMASALYAAATGLKPSNYIIGKVELAPDRVRSLADETRFDCALFEYWHAAASTAGLREMEIPCVLDMHNILWQSYDVQLKARAGYGAAWRRRALEKYKQREEQAWREFDGVVAINREEQAYVEERLAGRAHTFYAPMGIDLDLWPYSWEPAYPPRVAYYASFASPHNQRSAEMCASEIMPRIWEQHPGAELWLVGNKPPSHLRALEADPRVKVTGFVENVQPILSKMSVLLCPWSGRYGFRSRLVEVMALGVPVTSSHDAIAGMEFEHGRDILLGDDAATLAANALAILGDGELAKRHSVAARRQVEREYNVHATYDRLMAEMDDWLAARGGTTRVKAARP